MTTAAEEAEVQPSEFVTVNEYVAFEGMFEIKVLVPVPIVVTASGVRVIVHVPDEGNPLNTTLPVEKVHIG